MQSHSSLQRTAQRTLFQRLTHALPPRIVAPAPSWQRLAPNAPLHLLKTLVDSASDPKAWLAMQQDKHVLADPQRNFLMYAKTTEFMIALRGVMGVPSLRAESEQALLKQFLEDAHARHVYPVFYQADANTLQALNQLSTKPYRAYKLGEEAIIDLPEFSLDVPEFSRLRQNIRKAEKSGVVFEFCPQADAGLLERCQEISEQWLQQKRAKEKRFSLGRFHPPALLGEPMALVWQNDQLVAFANVLRSADQRQLSVDLMRQLDVAPRGTMDLLFARLFEWGKAQGYLEFSFGMCPLKDVSADALAHAGRWSQLAKHISQHGERFYNFRGVRQFKEKWHPQWRPRYLLVPLRRHVLPALIACTLEIAGGLRAVVSR